QWSPEALIELAVRHNLAELEVEGGGTRIRIVREHAPLAPQAGVRGELTPTAGAAAQAARAEEAVASNLVPIEAPMVGTFYRAAKPDAPPFVSEGDVVEEGQALCIIEAMKLMNEIESKVAGRIAKILVENGQPVEYGQTLFLVEPAR
ncbi:MAG TPA: acetyl-CoA carboxylase biotin carboxyl carrier protein, partial [Methylomirabilota bacterium]|nr:acetyl-CoA carboxylase biotin carboxyl carrier protein [Methylomirabilota bacterium]